MTNNVSAVSVFLTLLIAGISTFDNKNAGKCSFPWVEEDSNEQLSFTDTSKLLGLTNNSWLEVDSNIPERYNITVEIFTRSKNGLLLYASNGDHSNFTAIYVYMDEGYVILTIEIQNSSASIKSNDTYNDWKWHTIQIRNIKNENQLLIDGKTQGYELNVQRNMRIMMPVYVGGLPANTSLPPHLNIVTYGFCGCLSRILLGTNDVMSEAKAFGVLPCAYTKNQTSAGERTDIMKEFMTTGYSADENMTSTSQYDFLTTREEGGTSASSKSQDSVVEPTASVKKIKQNTLKYVDAYSTEQEESVITHSLEQTVTNKVIKHAITKSRIKVSQTSKTMKIPSLTTDPTSAEFNNITVGVKAQTYADDPLSNLPVYISIAIVVLTFACVLHLVYRKTVRMMRQKTNYGKIPIREMQELHEIRSGNEKTKGQNMDYTRVPSHNLQDEQSQSQNDRNDDKNLHST